MNGSRSSKQMFLLQRNMACAVGLDVMSQGARRVMGLLLAACLTAAPARASDGAIDWPMRLRADLVRLGALEWQLHEAAGNSCSVQSSDIGVVIDDRRAYQARDWPLLASALGLGELPVVAGLAPGGPAERAGLRVGDEILAIGGKSAEEIVLQHGTTALAADAMLAEIARATSGQMLIIEVKRGDKRVPVALVPVRHCAARLVLFPDRSVEAHSDNRNVAISTGMLAFARTDDELALAAGHELAHVINGDRRGGGMSARRRMEDAADELGLQLTRCAGYDATRALSLFERLRAKDWLGFLRAPTHRSWSGRVARLRSLPPAACPVTKS